MIDRPHREFLIEHVATGRFLCLEENTFDTKTLLSTPATPTMPLDMFEFKDYVDYRANIFTITYNRVSLVCLNGYITLTLHNNPTLWSSELSEDGIIITNYSDGKKLALVDGYPKLCDFPSEQTVWRLLPFGAQSWSSDMRAQEWNRIKPAWAKYFTDAADYNSAKEKNGIDFIHVLMAAYGTPTHGRDVTDIITILVHSGDRKKISVTNAGLAGVDPAPGAVKQFGIVYKVNGSTPQARGANEGEEITL